jgi:hypothetical protein
VRPEVAIGSQPAPLKGARHRPRNIWHTTIVAPCRRWGNVAAALAVRGMVPGFRREPARPWHRPRVLHCRLCNGALASFMKIKAHPVPGVRVATTLGRPVQELPHASVASPGYLIASATGSAASPNARNAACMQHRDLFRLPAQYGPRTARQRRHSILVALLDDQRRAIVVSMLYSRPLGHSADIRIGRYRVRHHKEAHVHCTRATR